MKFFFFPVLLITWISSNAQKQGNIWHFGIKAGIDFSTGIPVAIFNGKTGSDIPLGSNQEGTSVISDSSGKLLFYTGGETIWNRNHIPMPNGTGIMGGVSSTQSSLIVPQPGTNNLFLVFTSDEFQHYLPPSLPKGYRYSVVDMCQDSGRGDVLVNQKNILLLDSATEKLAACEDNSGDGYWILGHKMFSSKFYAWHLTAAGLSTPIVSDIGTTHGRYFYNSTWNSGSAQGQLKFNAQGTQIALAIGNYDPAMVDLFDFNKSTGTVSNFCHIAIDSLLQKRSYGVEFSPDGSKLYAGVAGGVGGIRVYQYDLTAGGGNCNAIISSQFQVFRSNVGTHVTGMQIGPDNKIYLLCNTVYDLGRINFPNLPGSACGFDSSVISFSPGKSDYAIPAFIAGYKYHNGIPCQIVNPPVSIDSSCSLDVQIRPYPNPFNNVLIVDKKPTTCKVAMDIYNILGQLVVKGKIINNGRNEIRLSNLSAGIYYYKFTSNDNILTGGKILKL